jgi:LysM domain
MEAVMSALSAIEAPVLTGTVLPGAAEAAEPRGRQRLRLVAAPVPGRPGAGISGAGHPRASSTWVRQSGVPASPTPLQLTRRGRVVVTALAIVGATVVVLLVSLLASGGAQASSHRQPGAVYQGMHQMVVQPGQTLWSIASAAEPTADPRSVVQQIMSVNALSGSGIQAGQLLWVPR